VNQEIKVYDRRGAVDDRPANTQGIDPWEEADRMYQQHLKEQDRRRRFYAGEDEFEPAMFSVVDDADDIREMAEDPYLLFLLGEKKGQGNWVPFIDEHGTRWIKVVPMPHADWEHVEAFKMPRFGDNRVNLTHGEQEEVRRASMGSRLREEEMAMDFRSPSKFLLDEATFATVDFELPNVPEDVLKWLEETAWPNHTRFRNRLFERLTHIMTWKVPGKDNRKREVKAIRRDWQAKQVNILWGKFWHWWVNKSKAMKETGHRPMTNRQLASIKAIFEEFRAGMNLDKPVMRFWAKVHCLKCNTQRNQLLPLSYAPRFEEETSVSNPKNEIICLEEKAHTEKIFCKTCGTKNGMVLWFEEHTIIKEDGHAEPDWFEVAQNLKDKIEALYKVAAELEEIRPLEASLHHIEHLHIKIEADALLWGEHDEIDERFC